MHGRPPRDLAARVARLQGRTDNITPHTYSCLQIKRKYAASWNQDNAFNIFAETWFAETSENWSDM